MCRSLAGILRGLIEFSHVELPNGVLQFSWIGIACLHHGSKWGKVWSLENVGILRDIQCGETALTFPEPLPRSNSAFPVICTEERLGNLFVGTTLLQLVRTGKTSYSVRLTQCHKSK